MSSSMCETRYLLQRECSMVLEICAILLRITEAIDDARGYNRILNCLVGFGLDIACEECVGLDY
jgi:hypothetical protein